MSFFDGLLRLGGWFFCSLRWRQRLPHLFEDRFRLQQALSLVPEPREFCISVSDTLRWYLEERFSLRAPERTTEEFLQELQSSDVLSSQQKLSLSDFLQRCDLVKFAKFEPREPELLELHDSALRLVDETAPYAMPPAPNPPQSAGLGVHRASRTIGVSIVQSPWGDRR